MRSIDSNSQKSLANQRAPRVQIEYDVEVYGENRHVELPFVLGVMADLSGHAGPHLPPVAQREFVELDMDSLSRRMRQIGPTLHLRVSDRVSGSGELDVDLAFNQIEDFRPDEVIRQVPALRRLLETREKLASLLTYMDGKVGAEDLIRRILSDRSLLEKIAVGTKTEPRFPPNGSLSTDKDVIPTTSSRPLSGD